MTAYDPTEWSDLFVASAGATAALAGLVFVAISINIDRILKLEGLPERALETVLTLLGAVVVSLIGLIPGQGHVALGAEPPAWLAGRLFVRAIGTVPLLVGGVSMLVESGGGLYWIAAGIIGAITGAVVNAWVLLVEILR